MKKFKIYLAGPITGLTYEGATDWRQKFIDMVKENNDPFLCYSPMRGKGYLLKRKSETLGTELLKAGGYEGTLYSTGRRIMARDTYDVRTADAVFVNFLGAEKVSIGTTMEIAWAYEHRIPIVCAMEENNIHHHEMIEQACPFIEDNLDLAYTILKNILLPTSH